MCRGRQRSANGNCEPRQPSAPVFKKDLIFLCKDDIIKANRFILQQEHNTTGRFVASTVINDGLLEDIVEGQNRTVFGHDPYPTLFEKAAFLLVNLAWHECFLDGNKRTAWEACRAFLCSNGIGIYYNSEVATRICGQAAQVDKTKLDPYEIEAEISRRIKAMTEWIRNNSFQLPSLHNYAPPVNSGARVPLS